MSRTGIKGIALLVGQVLKVLLVSRTGIKGLALLVGQVLKV